MITAVATVAIARKVPLVIVMSMNVVPMPGIGTGMRCEAIEL
jgi:hypothetical protein